MALDPGTGMPGIARWLMSAHDALRAGTPQLQSLGRDLEEALVAIARLRFWVEAISPWHKLDADYRGSEPAWSSVSKYIAKAPNEQAPQSRAPSQPAVAATVA
jgi:hypothetical protein